ncbi:MAG TPA: chaperonin [Clostridia bacterium]|jgi:chaperonin GroEL (HSP60 family)|nr:chaperonin [Clostridia bacterium]
MSLKQVTGNSEVDERLAALLTNSNAVRAITAAVEGTIGPKGLDTMLVDRFGEVVITNDGVTILDKMDANHPAAKLMINIAKAQQEEVGDGTTTATILAGSLVAEGVNQVIKGVPVVRIIEGMKQGLRQAKKILEQSARPITDLDDPLLYQVALIAGREHEDIADLVISAAKLIGKEKIIDKNFKLADTVVAEVGAENEVFMGLIINRERMNSQMPAVIKQAKIVVIDDALEPEELSEEALATEAGFNRFRELREEFRYNIYKLTELGVNLVLVDRRVDDMAEEILTEAQAMVVQRVSNKDLKKIAEHTGAKPMKRTGLKRSKEELEKYLGFADLVYEDEKLEQIRIIGGKSKPMATILVGAATEEVVGERERIAKDAASSVQAALKQGVVPGGGSIELGIMRQLKEFREMIKGMTAYGVDCVIEALKRPLAQIVINAGFNALEKVEDVIAAQAESGKMSLGINCDSGEVADMYELGVVDPVLVKNHALKAAGEIAEAILRIDTIIKKREEKEGQEKSVLSEGQDLSEF